jgi:methionyl aminopeptidase
MIHRASPLIWTFAEHTLLVTEDGVEVLTARQPDSPGGPVPMPDGKSKDAPAAEPATNGDTKA